LRDRRALVLQLCGHCRLMGAIKGGLIRTQQILSERILGKGEATHYRSTTEARRQGALVLNHSHHTPSTRSTSGSHSRQPSAATRSGSRAWIRRQRPILFWSRQKQARQRPILFWSRPKQAPQWSILFVAMLLLLATATAARTTPPTRAPWAR